MIDGPFAETKALIAGCRQFQVKSREEAIEWVRRAPNPFPGSGRTWRRSGRGGRARS